VVIDGGELDDTDGSVYQRQLTWLRSFYDTVGLLSDEDFAELLQKLEGKYSVRAGIGGSVQPADRVHRHAVAVSAACDSYC
jgi:hypothetical protein